MDSIVFQYIDAHCSSTMGYEFADDFAPHLRSVQFFAEFFVILLVLTGFDCP